VKKLTVRLQPGDAVAAPWEWALSPAYDLNPCAGPGGEHSTTVLGEGRNPTRAHCLDLARQSGIARADAVGIIDEVNSALGRWTSFAEEAGCSARAVAEVSGLVRLL
jgi:serine/threonine-protein kinase HipA